MGTVRSLLGSKMRTPKGKESSFGQGEAPGGVRGEKELNLSKPLLWTDDTRPHSAFGWFPRGIYAPDFWSSIKSCNLGCSPCTLPLEEHSCPWMLSWLL